MGFLVKEGNYEKMGAICQDKEVIFTFAAEKEDACSIVLINRRTREQIEVEVPQTFCLGSLRSIAVEIGDYHKYFYLYKINGVEKMDPYAYGVVGREKWNDANRADVDYAVFSNFMSDTYDWSMDVLPEIRKSQMFLYKLHVRGFSMDHGATKGKAGTFAAVCDKLDYLKGLGVTSLELMPIYEFEEMHIPVKHQVPSYVKWDKEEEDLILPENTAALEKGHLNFWGYGEGNYFAVKESYAKKPGQASLEFKQLVQNLHERKMECILEFYFPSKTNHNLILDALRYWVREYHVDGFHLLGDSIPITAIAQDMILSRTKIFYHSFDENAINHEKKYKNLYVYKEEYLYPARKILNHINGDMVEFTNQQKKQGEDLGYVNYICSNNGFTLADVFMYNDKHNEDNGENNGDGNPWNFSNNYGVEGPTKKRFINKMRKRQWRNSILMLALAQGVPMIFSGDEFGNSQNGNNNAYCQDNEIGWINWKNVKGKKADIAFVSHVMAFRKDHSLLAKETPFTFSDYAAYGCPDVSYHGENAWLLGFDLGRMNLGVMYCGAYSDSENQEDIYVAYNFFSAMSTLALPKLGKKKKWYLAIDSASDKEPVLKEYMLCENQNMISIKPQSICVLIGR